MKLSLVSDDKKSFLNLDFTKFFSEKGYWIFENEKTVFVKRKASRYKELIKNLVDKYININMVNEYNMPPIYIVDMWFKQALDEKLKAPQKEFLEKNYQIFKKMYKLEDFRND